MLNIFMIMDNMKFIEPINVLVNLQMSWGDLRKLGKEKPESIYLAGLIILGAPLVMVPLFLPLWC